MLKISVVGCTGKLGKVIIKNILNDSELKLTSCIGRKGNQFIGQDISEIIGEEYKNISISDAIQMTDECDVFIDCTNAESFINQNAEQYLHKFKPVVIATTGFSDDDFIKIKQLAKQMPIIYSANYSIALYNYIESLKLVVKTINEKTDVRIIELHHNQKKDAPSGTAKKIQEALCEANPNLQKDNINISSVRGGNIFGEHRVVFVNEKDEILEYIHKVFSRESFAAGIIQASKWLSKQPIGYYTMNNFMN
ncbi:MAG: 4-hydroxy-tetrahydrodipicolinate reductase [Oscillospiraceae bacterium]|nr:4-hydroxy-tetrahydrodipicolinate reductase [Oscillospiraceae bacterium]